jgi:coenzyme F420-0:L-glutamate ligase/coenzyme F420-1:gamma-L-glutamate ligase
MGATAPRGLSILPLAGIPLVEPGDDVAALILDAARESGVGLGSGDIVAVAQKIVSKAEGRYVRLAEVTPSPAARDLAAATGKDPRYVEVVLSQSTEVVRSREQLLIVAHKRGFVMANAGIDESNVAQDDGGPRVLLLPEDPDGAAAALKRRLDEACGADLGVVVTDSFGRPLRNGVVGIALGAAGVPSLVDLVGAPDLFGRPMRVTEVALADQLAAAATLVMGEGGEGVPAAVIKGLQVSAPHRPAAALIRPKERDLFR